MPFATDRREKMFTAANLNSLYNRFDQKVYRTLNGVSPLMSNSTSGVWQGLYPYGVWYVYRTDPDTCKRLKDNGDVPSPSIPGIGYYRDEHSQQAAKDALSTLETKYQDVAGGQVYVDHHSTVGDDFTCDVGSIHYSFELLRREVAGIEYDVHLGWDPEVGSGMTSYVRGSLGPSTPTLPPGRIHKHRLAVAEIALEGPTEFRILNTYQRYDCWRVHNCGTSTVTVYLQNPDGGADRHSVPPAQCRSFRRKPDGTWPAPMFYFFPYFTGDIPFLAEGPPSWAVTNTSEFLALERSAQANNVANPFVMFEWRRVMFAVHDPHLPYDIRQIYTGSYADPSNANTTIGDAVFTWGRARITYSNANNDVFDDQIRIFSSTQSLPERLRAIGLTVVENANNLTLTSQRGVIRIYPIDANIFTTQSTPYWEVGNSPVSISTYYPVQYTTESGTVSWQAGNTPTIFETMRTLRRRVAVEVGFLNSYDDAVDIIEEKVSQVTLTPMGLMCQAATNSIIVGSLFENFHSTATPTTLWTDRRPVNFGAGADFNWAYTSGTKVFYLSVPGAAVTLQWANVMPARNLAAPTTVEAVNRAFVPPGGPWGFSSSVYDFELVRCFEINLANGVDDRPWGADFWQNKWGGPGGVDASVRIPGSPNKTSQYAYVPTAANSSFVDLVPAGTDDIFKDRRGASFAHSVPFASATFSPQQQDGLTDIRWTGGVEQVGFDVPYTEVGNPYLPGGGPFFHKIPKSVWLWSLLEWSVRSWTRSVPLGLAQDCTPVRDAFNGAAANSGLVISSLLLGTTGYEPDFDLDVYYLTEASHDILVANGCPCFNSQDSGGNDYWFVPAQNLQTYCREQGFVANDFSTENGQPTESPPVAATTIRPYRTYSQGEQVEAASYFDVGAGYERYEWLRYVDLRLPNELAS
jgi:hypothetical protein